MFLADSYRNYGHDVSTFRIQAALQSGWNSPSAQKVATTNKHDHLFNLWMLVHKGEGTVRHRFIPYNLRLEKLLKALLVIGHAMLCKDITQLLTIRIIGQIHLGKLFTIFYGQPVNALFANFLHQTSFDIDADNRIFSFLREFPDGAIKVCVHSPAFFPLGLLEHRRLVDFSGNVRIQMRLHTTLKHFHPERNTRSICHKPRIHLPLHLMMPDIIMMLADQHKLRLLQPIK